MEVNKILQDDTMIVEITGRIDTNTAPVLENQIMSDMPELKHLVLDFAQVDYISSAGLRLLLTCQKKMNEKGTMVVKNICEDIKEIFEMTGFVDILTIE